jgi:hypothetical protein
MTDAERKKFYEDKKRLYPHEVSTALRTPQPDDIDKVRYGEFVRIQFPERDRSIWLFTTQSQAVMFQNDYRGHFG